MVMNDNLLESKEISTQTCNAFGCYNIATIRLVLPVGSKSLTIVVCENCRPKFEDIYNI
jgi:hypothetical protein